MKNNSHNLKEKKNFNWHVECENVWAINRTEFLHLRLSWVLLFHSFSIMVKDKSIKTTTLTDGLGQTKIVKPLF